MAKNSAAPVYDESSIQRLNPREHIRLRPGMYVGGTDVRAMHHLVYEIVDNAIDRCLAGFASKIEVRIHTNNSITVEDDGRGIPVETHSTGISALEVVMTKLHAGGKFNEEGGAYKVSGGLHGVGAAVVNALSETCIVEVFRGGKVHKQSYSRGVPKGPKEEVGETDRTGTKTTFKPDDEIFDVTEYNADTLTARLRELAFLNRGLRIILIDERDSKPKEKEFHYEGGLVEFVEHINKSKQKLHDKVIYFEH
ncbi:MAG: ATP-binding protein, partial [Anaerolineae bacterium]|nr:ATP-binding protein [Anaerolineae bacterium]